MPKYEPVNITCELKDQVGRFFKGRWTTLIFLAVDPELVLPICSAKPAFKATNGKRPERKNP